MPTYQKIPKKIAAGTAIQKQRFVIFTSFDSKASDVEAALKKIEGRKQIPAVGSITVGKHKYFYCRADFSDIKSFYAK